MAALFIRFLVFTGFTVALAAAARPAAQQPDSAFDNVFDEYLAGYWKANPAGAATPAGVHTHDAGLEDFTAAAIQSEIQRNRGFLRRFERLAAGSLPPGHRVDLAIALDHIHLALLDLEEIQSWKRNPLGYVSLLRGSVEALVKREFAPAERRFRAVAARLKLFPRALLQARANLDNPPEVQTREAAEAARGLADFVEKDLPQAAAGQGSGRKLQREVARESARAATALRQFEAWLQSNLLPRSTGSAVLGAETYGRRVRHLGSALPPAELLAAAERELEATLGEMRRVAAAVSPGRPLPDVLAELSQQQMHQRDVAAAFRNSVAEARRFVAEKKLAPLPQTDRLRVLAAPAFLNSDGAFLDPPGPFESDLPSFFYFSTGAQPLSSSVARETYPGRYTQLEQMNRSPRLARKIFASRAFTEGWAHYSEQAMSEAGFASDPKARLARLHNAALAQLSAIGDVRLHTGQLAPEQIVKLWTGLGLEEPDAVSGRVRFILLYPAAASAGYSGKLEILRLREEMKKKLGPAFVLGEFHEALLSLGAPPVHHASTLLLSK